VVIESSTTLNQDFDLGLSLAIQGLRTRNVTSSGTSSETTTRIETVRIQSLPRVEVYARYVSALAKSAHSFEAELGLGLGFNKTTVSSTDLSTTPQSDRTTAFTARASLGFGLLWNESIVVPIQFGLAFQSLGSKSFSNAVYAVERKGSMSGLYLKSGLRYRF
jgi:hypothetical protein